MKRNCEICGSNKFNIVHKQEFVLENNFLSNYDVVICRKCGFVFVSNLISQKKLENFYKKNIKYAYEYQHNSLPVDAKKLHNNSFKIIDNYLRLNNSKSYKSTIRILDIGCATGFFLNIFKKNQYKNLLGIDPSVNCSRAAKKLYRIRVLPLTLSEFKKKEKFDLIILGSVMEHLNDLNNNLLKISTLLKEDGIVFISVPDGDNFGKILHEPYLEFSLEHINFFTRLSLRNLLSKYKLGNISFNSLALKTYGGYALNSLWKKNKLKTNIVFDKSAEIKIKSYIKKSFKKLKTISNKIDKLVESKEEVIIWGVGSLTSRLLSTTSLNKANIQFFVDSNANLQEKTINGFFVKSPDILKNKNITIFVSTYIYGSEIKKTLLNKYNYKGKIILI